jgi:hypothetical protein
MQFRETDCHFCAHREKSWVHSGACVTTNFLRNRQTGSFCVKPRVWHHDTMSSLSSLMSSCDYIKHSDHKRWQCILSSTSHLSKDIVLLIYSISLRQQKMCKSWQISRRDGGNFLLRTGLKFRTSVSQHPVKRRARALTSCIACYSTSTGFHLRHLSVPKPVIFNLYTGMSLKGYVCVCILFNWVSDCVRIAGE